MKRQGICYVFGAAKTDIADLKVSQNDLVICADGGYLTAIKMGLTVDIFVGDCDSLGYLPKDAKKTIKLNVEKNDTDVFHSAVVGIEEGYSNFVFVGCTGGQRQDHTFANIQTLIFLAKQGYNCKMIDEKNEIAVICNNEIYFDADKSGIVSVFSLSEKSFGCTEEGLKYPLKNATLTFDNPLGVSNEFCSLPSKITVTEGVLMIVTQHTSEKPKDFC